MRENRIELVAFINAIILVMFLVVTLSGCAGITSLTDSSTLLPPKQVSVPQKKVVKREPGSLWSEDSIWNTIYSNPPTRGAGDILVVKLSKRFKMQILGQLDREFPVNDEKKDKDKGKELASVESKPEAAKAGPGSEKVADEDSGTLHATILEALPRGVYRIAASDTLRVGTKDPLVTLEGDIRDKDISDDDSVSSDAILNLALNVKPFGGHRKPSFE